MQKGQGRIFWDILFFLLLFTLDRVTKSFSLSFLSQASLPICSFFGIEFYLTLTMNKGAAWGAFAEFPLLLFVVRLCFVAFLFFFYIKQASSLLSRLAVVAILAGAIGNIFDSIFLGHVVDMIHFVFWGLDYPVFNLADVFIFLGSIAFFVSTFFEKKRG